MGENEQKYCKSKMAARSIGTGMRLTMQMIRRKFSEVKHIQTEDLQRMVSEPQSQVVLLVSLFSWNMMVHW